MNKNSLKAYFDESNQRKFNSHKAIIFRELSKNPCQHSYQIARNVKLSNESCKKRITDLLNEGSIIVTDSVKYHGNTVSIYKVISDPDPYSFRKLTLRTWMKEHHPDILKEYDLLFN